MLVAYCPRNSHQIVLGKARLNDETSNAHVQRQLTFDIPSGTLESVFIAFQQVSGIEVVIPDDAMRTISSPGVKGRFSIDQALREILRDTGISYRFSDHRTVTLEIHAQAEQVEVRDDARLILSSPKYTQPLLDTPQTVTVISKEVMEEQGATTLRDVLKNVPGLTITAGEGGNPAGDNLTLRGFSARNDIFVDGVRDISPQARDPFNLEQVDVITGACNLGFLFLVISGFYLWWPRSWNLNAVRNVTWFRRGLAARARDFNWHNTIGFWSAGPLFIIVLSSVVISYTWAGNLVYRIVGETPPAPRANQPNANTGSNKDSSATFNDLDTAWLRAEKQASDWQSISLQLANTSQLTFNIDRGTGGQPQKRAQLVLDRATGEVVRWEPFSSYSRGRQLRSILRFAHTGEVLGIAGQTIAGVVSAGGAVLVLTGLGLAFRRFLSWFAKRAKSKQTVTNVVKPLPDSVGD